MDCELKYVIAICLIVKIAALSPEFSISEEAKKSEQSPGKTLSRISEIQETFAGRQHQRTAYNWGPGRGQFQKINMLDRGDAAKTGRIKENLSFDTCEHKLELLESSLNWRDIRKTLRWLERILASNQTNVCHRRKDKRKFQHSLKLRNMFKKKKSTDFDSGWTRNHSQNKKLKKERKHKQGFWKNRFRKEKSLKEKLKSERKGSSLLDKKYSIKYFEKIKFYQKNPPALNTTILKPNSVLFDVKKILLKRTKSKSGNCKSRQLWTPAAKCEEQNSEQTNRESENLTESWKVETKSKEHENNRTKSPQTKPWPHFVYHRVSSNFLHPESTNRTHKESAYVAISVVTTGKQDSTDNNENT